MIKNEIRLLLSSMKTFIAKLPTQKQQKATIQMLNITKQEKDESEILKDLKYQVNFLKLTNPNILIPKQVEAPVDEQDEQENNTTQQQQQQQQQNQGNQNQTGTYILQDGKLVQGQGEKKEEVDFSNWYAGNVDPDDLKKHKELLDRQHYSGPFWEGKQKPKSIIEEKASSFIPAEGMEKPKAEENPNIVAPKEAIYENVKR